MLNELLKELENHYGMIKSCSSTSTRKRYGEKMIIIIKTYPQVEQYWEYKPQERYWINKFHKIKTYHCSTITIENGIVKDPITNLLNAPSYSGLYLIGQTTFNPYTDEKQYWVKVGTSSDIWQRFKSGYVTCSPCTALIDTTKINKEAFCHKVLRSVALGRCQQNTEWWLVDRNTYLEICEKKFNYFFK